MNSPDEILEAIEAADGDALTFRDVRKAMGIYSNDGMAIDLPAPDRADGDAAPRWSKALLLRAFRGESLPGGNVTFR